MARVPLICKREHVYDGKPLKKGDKYQAETEHVFLLVNSGLSVKDTEIPDSDMQRGTYKRRDVRAQK